ncbi:MAG: hypothetical protein AB1505_01205 [Candidatus Latescibacterota bacterium]
MLKKIGISAAEWLYLLSHPAHCRLVARDLGGRLPGPQADALHLQGALDWLCRAQDTTGCGGVSAGYFLRAGWGHPYPETTGYIIPTFLDAAAALGREEYRQRARRMGDWEIEVQLPSGAVRGGRGRLDRPGVPIVFNTGQVLQGWTALYRTTGQERYGQAARRAADWLAGVQEADGSWCRHTYGGSPRTYHARVAWALLQAHRETGDPAHRRAGEDNVEWVLRQAGPDGWIPAMELEPGQPPPTHTIAYTLRGLLEAASELGGETAARALDLVRRASTSLLQAAPASAVLPGSFAARWRPATPSSCLTGSAQLALVWLRLEALCGDRSFRAAALQLVEQVKAAQPLQARHPGIQGGVPGSYPLWGAYLPYALPNWAAKFLVDVLLCKQHLLAGA